LTKDWKFGKIVEVMKSAAVMGGDIYSILGVFVVCVLALLVDPSRAFGTVLGGLFIYNGLLPV
jgi:hypothetical protein